MSQLQKVDALLSAGRFLEARDACIKICKKNKNNLHARFLLGIAHGQLNEYKQAESCFKYILGKTPHDIQANYNLGLVYQKAREYVQAKKAYQNSIRLDPELFEAKYNLAEVLRESGNLGKAMDIYKELLVTRKYPHIVHLGIASALFSDGRYEEALLSIENAIGENTQNAKAYILKGRILCAIGQTDAGLEAYDKAIAIQPSLVDTYIEAGDIYFKKRDLIKAEIFYKNAMKHGFKSPSILLKIGDIQIIKSEPYFALEYYNEAINQDYDNPLCYAGLGQAYEAIGNIDKAVEYYEQSLALDSNLESALSGKARQLMARGRYEDAYNLISGHIENGTNHQDLVSVYAEIAIHQGNNKAALHALTSFLEHHSDEAAPPKKVHYQLGSLHDNVGEYDKAFVHFRMANEYSDEVVDIEKQLDFIENMIMAFPKDALHYLPSSGNKSKLPIFIVGMPRSGTTLVEQILDSHPLLHGAGELHDIIRIFTRLTNNDDPDASLFPAKMMNMDRNDLLAQADAYIAKLRKMSQNAIHISDKMPHNFLFIGLIELLFPNARIIHCHRNSIDTCLSIYFHDMNATHAYATDLENLGNYYTKYLKIMGHWNKTSNLPILDVNYETMISDQARISREIIEFCGLEWDSKCLDYHNNKRAVITHSQNQVRQAIYTTSVDRWRNYKKHITPLINALNCIH